MTKQTVNEQMLLLNETPAHRPKDTDTCTDIASGPISQTQLASCGIGPRKKSVQKVDQIGHYAVTHGQLEHVPKLGNKNEIANVALRMAMQCVIADLLG